MNRKFIRLTALSAVLASSLSVPAEACHPRRYVSSPRYPVAVRQTVHVAAPAVTVVRPTVVRPVVAPVAVVAPPQVAENLPTVPSGATLTLPANFLGQESGSVFMVFNDIKLPVQIHQWSMTGVTISLPPMAIKDAVVVRLDVVLPNGSLGLTQKVRVTAPAPVVLHAVGPTSPLPTNAALQQAAAAARPQPVSGAQVIPALPSGVAAQAGFSSQATVLAAPPAAQPAAAQVPVAQAPVAQASAAQQPVFGQPIVHPPGGAAPANAAVVPGSGAGTLASPLVLPPAGSATLEDPLANNPILNEHFAASAPGSALPTAVTAVASEMTNTAVTDSVENVGKVIIEAEVPATDSVSQPNVGWVPGAADAAVAAATEEATSSANAPVTPSGTLSALARAITASLQP